MQFNGFKHSQNGKNITVGNKIPHLQYSLYTYASNTINHNNILGHSRENSMKSHISVKKTNIYKIQ